MVTRKKVQAFTCGVCYEGEAVPWAQRYRLPLGWLKLEFEVREFSWGDPHEPMAEVLASEFGPRPISYLGLSGTVFLCYRCRFPDPRDLLRAPPEAE
jgi:hypothetical protein